AWTRKARMDATGLPRGGSRSPLQWMDATGLPRGGSRSPLHWMDATGLPRGGSRSPLHTGQTHHSCPSVAWNVTNHGTSPWHVLEAKARFCYGLEETIFLSRNLPVEASAENVQDLQKRTAPSPLRQVHRAHMALP
ncbi:MAG: hypothetical protein R6U98_16960, partial [Pirellulaceae bacterium]